MFTPNTRTPHTESRAGWLMSGVAALFTSHREAVQDMPRTEDAHTRTDAQTAEEWTGECLFDCYND